MLVMCGQDYKMESNDPPDSNQRRSARPDPIVEVSMMVSALSQAGAGLMPSLERSVIPRPPSSGMTMHSSSQVSSVGVSQEPRQRGTGFVYSDLGLEAAVAGQKRARSEEESTSVGWSNPSVHVKQEPGDWVDVSRASAATWAPAMGDVKRESLGERSMMYGSPGSHTQEYSSDSGKLSDSTRPEHRSPPYEGVKFLQ